MVKNNFYSELVIIAGGPASWAEELDGLNKAVKLAVNSKAMTSFFITFPPF
jgi:hypothetical protein